MFIFASPKKHQALLMKKNRFTILLYLPVFILATVAIFSSCHRNKSCDVVINVIDGNTSAPIPNCTVHMYPPPASANLSIQDQTGATDASGSVSFTFKLPAILQADVTPPATATVTAGGALVKLEEGKQVSKTIKLY